jgi:hypothetical protein
VKRKDITGQRFGRLTVLAFSHAGNDFRAHWSCKCDCGQTRVCCGTKLRMGKTTSCGRHKSEARAAANTTHGMHGTPEYRVWSHMIGRCYTPKAKDYRNYGGRGISVQDNYRFGENGKFGVEVFLAETIEDIGPKPGPGYVIDRIDNDGNYVRGNLRWKAGEAKARAFLNVPWARKMVAYANIFDLIYKGDGGIKIELAMAQRSPRPSE